MKRNIKTKKIRVKTEVTATSFKWYDPDAPEHSMNFNFNSQYDMMLFLKAAVSASRKYKRLFKK